MPEHVTAMRAPLRALRIGVDADYDAVCQPAVLERVQAAVGVLERLGASVRAVRLPPYAEFDAVSYAMGPEFSASLGGLWRDNPTEFGTEDTAWQVAGELVPAVDYIRGMQRRRVLARQYARATRDVDVLVCPSYAFERRPFGSWPDIAGRAATFDDAVRFTIPFDLLGVPALSLPCGFTDDGLPIGLQLVGRAFDETTVLRAAYAYEQATDWHRRRPPLSPV